MNELADLPLLLDGTQLQPLLSHPQLLILDVCSPANYAKHHLPGALHVAPTDLVCGIKPATGKLPNVEKLTLLFSRLGLTANSHVIAYDDEGGGWAGRLIWTLDVIGHARYSYLDGGLLAWQAEGRPLTTAVPAARATNFTARIHPDPIADLDAVRQAIGDEHTAIWDARSKEEYAGSKVNALRGGHIPGAINLDWLDLMDHDRQLRLKPLKALQNQLNALGLTATKTIITHCQTHHRSGLSYLLMKLLGYPSIKGYDGSWSEWGNREDTPIDNPSTP